MKDREWLTLPPGGVAKSIAIEAAELLEHFQWKDLTVEEIKKNAEKFCEIKKELADVVIYCLEMAVVLDVDLEQTVREKSAINCKKYPADVVKKWHAMKGDDENAAYHEHKKKLRAGNK